MAGCRAGFRLLALMAFSVAFSHAQDTITLASMTWSNDGTSTGLTVCATDAFNDNSNQVRLDVEVSDGSPQTTYEGENIVENCATFVNVTGLSQPMSYETKYELTVYQDDEELQQGTVTFAFPLSEGTAIDCGTSQFGRFKVESGAGLSDTNCLFDDVVSTTCYISPDESGNLCVPGLDTTDGNEDFIVCVPSVNPELPDPEISAVSLTYSESSGGSFKISSDVDTTALSLELLQTNKDDDPDSVSISVCDDNCSFDDMLPSQNAYELCGVYVDVDNKVTSVGTFEFQDLNLKVDLVGATVDFHFDNVGYGDSYVYNVYGDPTDPLPDAPSFILDCSHISPDSFCNGFFDDSSPTSIGVTFEEYTENVVIAPVPSTSSGSDDLEKKGITSDTEKNKKIVSISE